MFVSTVTQGGLYVFQIYDHFSCSGASLLLLSIFQSLAIGWVYGTNPKSAHLSFFPFLSFTSFVLSLLLLSLLSSSFLFLSSPLLPSSFSSFPILFFTQFFPAFFSLSFPSSLHFPFLSSSPFYPLHLFPFLQYPFPVSHLISSSLLPHTFFFVHDTEPAHSTTCLNLITFC